MGKPDLISWIQQLQLPLDGPFLLDQLAEAFADSSDYSSVAIGRLGDRDVYLCCITSLADMNKLAYSLGSDEPEGITASLNRYEGKSLVAGCFSSCEEAICKGSAVLCLKNSSDGIILDIEDIQMRNVSSPITENVLRGPMYAFNENLSTNSALIRQRIRSSKLKRWETESGAQSRTRIAIFHMSGAADPQLLEQIKQELKTLKVDGLQDSGELAQLLVKNRKMKLFPRTIASERPDRASSELLKGKLVLMVEGSPFAVILPAVYTDFWHSPEDSYVNPYVSYFLSTIRFLAMFINLYLPALYVALTSVNVDVNRLEISLAAAASREAVPYPVFVETLLMLLVIDFIVEAGIRLPRTISSTVTMVGGVVLGQAIIQASIVSNLLVIVVAATAITNFIVIDYQMGLVHRILKYFIMFGGTIAGILGIVFCFACLVFYLSAMESFGTPYLTTLLRKKGTST